jgi:hypothetical protein
METPAVSIAGRSVAGEHDTECQIVAAHHHQAA